MPLIVDLHIHSRFSRATSKRLNFESIYKWAKIKGIDVVVTGDFTHPAWFAEIKNYLEPAESGLFKLKNKFAKKQNSQLPESIKNNPVRFILGTEISNIYTKHGKCRRLHNLIIAPDLKTVSKIIARLSKIGNLKADGRPILGLDSKELLRISLKTNPDNLFIPAHIWTPWFAMFGSKSGFDSIEQAFEELTPEIVAIETGLSSDPFMNWRLSALKNITIVSNSDAHSPEKLGREANIINAKLNYKDIIDAIKTNDKRFVGTIEFFPQEGKYHFDGHRKCNICFSPAQSKKHKNICPKCGKPLTLGVNHRVGELANHPVDFKPKKHKKVEYIIPLAELIAEIKQVKSVNSKRVQEHYEKMYSTLGDEFSILRKIPIPTIKKAGFPLVAQAIKNLRSGNVHIQPGYDGVYGAIKAFSPGKVLSAQGQMSLEL